MVGDIPSQASKGDKDKTLSTIENLSQFSESFLSSFSTSEAAFHFALHSLKNVRGKGVETEDRRNTLSRIRNGEDVTWKRRGEWCEEYFYFIFFSTYPR